MVIDSISKLEELKIVQFETISSVMDVIGLFMTTAGLTQKTFLLVKTGDFY
jgi:hypothetical protein